MALIPKSVCLFFIESPQTDHPGAKWCDEAALIGTLRHKLLFFFFFAQNTMFINLYLMKITSLFIPKLLIGL